MVLGSERFELGRIFAGNDHGLGVNTGFNGTAAGNGPALNGAGAGRFLRVAAMGLDFEVGLP
jgi:hypothetical protein